MLQRQTPESRPEERFVELFQDVFGPAAAAKLDPQVHFRDILGRDRYIDFGLDSLLDRYALEIDGETYHHPAALTSEDYADQLIRQNSLVHQGWRVLRWTDNQIAEKPDEVREHLALLLDQAVRLTVPAEYLPSKRGSLIDLREYQEQALAQLEALRADGQQIALLAHAVGTGKTTTAVEHARRVGVRTLFLAHTEELVQQALDRFGELWPEALRARLGEVGDEAASGRGWDGAVYERESGTVSVEGLGLPRHRRGASRNIPYLSRRPPLLRPDVPFGIDRNAGTCRRSKCAGRFPKHCPSHGLADGGRDGCFVRRALLSRQDERRSAPPSLQREYVQSTRS